MPLLQVLYFATRVSGLRYGGQNGHFLIFMAWGRYSYDWITDVFEEFFSGKIKIEIGFVIVIMYRCHMLCSTHIQ